MAQGNVKSDIKSINASGLLDIKPAPGEEWVIHNIYYSGPVEIYQTNGTLSIKFDADTTNGGHLGMVYHATNSVWIQIKNTGASTITVGYDGIQTK
jgi:hypothetical protein